MKKSMMIGLMLISLVLISGISGCIPSEEKQKIISEIKIKYSNVSDYSISIKEGSYCSEILVKKPDKFKKIHNPACEENGERWIFIMDGNISYEFTYWDRFEILPGKTRDESIEVTSKSIYPYNIGEKQIGQFPFEWIINQLNNADAEISLIGKEPYEPLGIEVYHLKVNIPQFWIKADFWVDKETYMLVKMLAKAADEPPFIIEIQDSRINEGIPDSEFEPLETYPIVERKNLIDMWKEKCENFCKTKESFLAPEGLVYSYCIDRGGVLIPGAQQPLYAYCWEDPINVECPEIEC